MLSWPNSLRLSPSLKQRPAEIGIVWLTAVRELGAFVFGGGVESDEVELFPQAAADAEAVEGLDFGAVEVGGEMGYHLTGDEQVVPGKEYLGHNVTIVTEMFLGAFGAKVVKAIGFGFVVLEREGAVFANGSKSGFAKLIAYLAAGF